MTTTTDVPEIVFVDPNETDSRFRVVLWAAPGEGKSVGAASAPDPLVVVSADRPGAYRFARRHYPGKDIREVRFENSNTLNAVYKYVKDNPEVETVVLDPFQGIYDRLSKEFPTRDGDINYGGLNDKITGFMYSLRPLGVHLVIVAHERLSDAKKGDGKLYPATGGPALINKVLAESDIVAHVERIQGDGEDPDRYEAQLAPVPGMVGKESTGVLGDRRPLDLSEWFSAAAPDTSDLPWDDSDPDSPGGEFDLAEARAEA